MVKRSILSLLTLLLFIRIAQAVDVDTTTYSVDVNSSTLNWSIDVHHGTVLLKKGTIKMQGKKLIAACVTVLMDSVNDQDITYELMRKTLHNVLRSDVFFNTKKYPYSFFVLDKAKLLSNGAYLVQGDLTITGVSNCVQFTIYINKKGNVIEITSSPFKIDRLRWGITSYSTHAAKGDKNFIVSDNITFSFRLVAKEE